MRMVLVSAAALAAIRLAPHLAERLVFAHVSAERGHRALLAAVGRLSSTTLGLGVVAYDPSIHFDQVKGKWIGTRTPDGN